MWNVDYRTRHSVRCVLPVGAKPHSTGDSEAAACPEAGATEAPGVMEAPTMKSASEGGRTDGLSHVTCRDDTAVGRMTDESR